MNCKVFVEAAIIEPIYNHADVYCVAVYHQYMKVFVSLNISFFSFEKLLLTWFLWNFKDFVEATIYEPLIMFTPLKYFNHLRFPNNPFYLSKSQRSK